MVAGRTVKEWDGRAASQPFARPGSGTGGQAAGRPGRAPTVPAA